MPNGHATQHEGRSSKGCTDANRAIALSPATNGSIYQSSHGSYGSQQRAHKKKVMSWTALFLKMILKVFQNPFSCFLELTSFAVTRVTMESKHSIHHPSLKGFNNNLLVPVPGISGLLGHRRSLGILELSRGCIFGVFALHCFFDPSTYIDLRFDSDRSRPQTGAALQSSESDLPTNRTQLP